MFLGLAEHARGDLVRAVQLLAAGEAISEAIGASVLTTAPFVKLEHDQRLAACRASLTRKAYATAWNIGRRKSIRNAIEDALEPLPSDDDDDLLAIRRRSAAPTAGQLTPRAAPALVLTAREHEVLDLLTRGLTSKEIANALMISTRTVEHHRASLSAKLGVRGRAELIARAAHRAVVIAN